jgi:hypothetical protein
MPNGNAGSRVPEWEAVASGARRGLAFCNDYDIRGAPAEEISSAVERAARVIQQQFPEGPPPDRAVDLFISNVAVAATCRFVFEGTPLDSKELENGLTFFRGFLNSAWHF